ncbi:PREDICTED: transcription initiation factor TFIID subunit 11-like [Nicrophorus vespilloides]|uniref:Transcription initiation factor TFIID subunit 11-like n=1 Tax=Nicrophorus vespilloides TaxID=110193 RepID=A0ABM1MJC9_NICVS|nr:PREDICTED: transcription initiation factor TFIID subunit 11-like [Nicrophorus vespilloides]
MATDNTLDYDDIISQNILIRKDQDATDEQVNYTVEVVKKQNEDYENMYNIQAALYQMDDKNQNAESEEEEDDDDDGSGGEQEDLSDYDYEVETEQQQQDQSRQDSSPLSESGSESEWVPNESKNKGGKKMYKCLICSKECPTKKGLTLHTIRKHKSKPTEEETNK